MKMNVSIAFVGVFLVSSFVLQGCGILGTKDQVAKEEVAIDDEAKKIEASEDKEEGTARCTRGKFSCSYSGKEWCAEQEKKCNSPTLHPFVKPKSCHPKCTWECESPKCDQDCAPKCGEALCSTRCKRFQPRACEMQCDQPNCKVVCPKHNCPSQDCAACKTECGKPVCKPVCQQTGSPSCRHLCAQPRCKWECKKPTACPKPVCHMKCETPHDCMDNTHMVQQLPPLEPGETEVAVGHTKAPKKSGLVQDSAALVHDHASTMRVDIVTMGKDLKLQKSQVDMRLASMDAVGAAPATWTRRIKKHGGQVKESEASCTNGTFQCQGDPTWCKEQEAIVCHNDHHESAFLQQRPRMQGRLQA